MQADVRDTALYREISDLWRRFEEPFGTVSSFADGSASPDGTKVAFTGTRRASLDVDPVSRVCLLDVATGTADEVTNGPHDDRAPAWSPDGRTLAFLSDRRHPGRYGLFLLEADRLGEAWAAPEVPGSIEWLSWSPDGTTLLLGVAAPGAEKAGVQGSGRIATDDEADRPDWLPTVSASDDAPLWRRAWRYDAAERTVRPLSRDGLNVWEAVWCGNDAIAAIVSESPGEEVWYDAPLALVDAATGDERVLYRGAHGRQLGWPAASPDGSRLAVVQARASDRWLVAGDVLLVDPETGATTPVDTGGVDVTALRWRDADRLAYYGQRGLDNVAGDYDAAAGATEELWSAGAASGYLVQPVPLPDGTAVVELSAWDRPTEITQIGKGVDRSVHVFASGRLDPAELGREERLRWTAADGLEIEGLLYTPPGDGPFATVLLVHGGPVAREYSRAPARHRYVSLLLSRGYAVLVPNVRGSTGRGQDYAERVVGDMGGAETGDHLAGLDALVARGVADPARLGVIGGSHGGFMTTWLVTQAPDRFAAAVAISPVTDWRSQHWTSNIAGFDAVFVGPVDDPIRDERSPVVHAHKVRTPTFVTAGDVDRCTPPGQALEFHQALLEQGVPTACAIYPGEGHGVRGYPAVLDWMTRITGWFEEWMPARR